VLPFSLDPENTKSALKNAKNADGPGETNGKPPESGGKVGDADAHLTVPHIVTASLIPFAIPSDQIDPERLWESNLPETKTCN
jgi:hypothetical protein